MLAPLGERAVVPGERNRTRTSDVWLNTVNPGTGYKSLISFFFFYRVEWQWNVFPFLFY